MLHVTGRGAASVNQCESEQLQVPPPAPIMLALFYFPFPRGSDSVSGANAPPMTGRAAKALNPLFGS